MSTSPSRILYLPNESGEARQWGPRLALARLLDAGHIDDARICSYLWRRKTQPDVEAFEMLSSLVKSAQPNVILIQHPAGTGLTALHWNKLRGLADFTLIYHEGDAYDRWRKTLPPESRDAAAASDITFTVGASKQVAYHKASGARDVRWTPSTFNPDDFGKRDIPHGRDFDIVMIANESSSRIPFASMPGSRRRIELVRRLTRRFGKRFAIFGNGWTGPNAQGPIDYLQQEEIVQSAWISISWDHYPNEAKSFSDRLPIALASGTVHVTSSHPGYDEIFPLDSSFIHHRPSVSGVIKAATSILDSSDQVSLLEAMRQGRSFANAHFRQDDNLVEMLNASGAGIDPVDARAAWAVATRRLDEM